MTFDSKAEAKASPEFTRLGCIPARSPFPLTFTDADGTEFRALPDFHHPATGLFIEFKGADTLNGKKSKATADKAIERQRVWKGSLIPWDWLQHGWNHAAAKIAITQSAIASTGRALLLVFAAMPGAETIKRLNSRQVFWLVLDTPQWRQFASFLTFASAGFPVRLIYAHPETGKPLHEFRTRSFAGQGRIGLTVAPE